jgi:hypothetical protein
MQAEAAASVAGEDRLVLVVGPAGAGKTTMLHAAVTDLTGQGRPVFGLAPTAKAARVLGSETGMECDTVAKLLHEWHRTDRPPDPRWRLAAGTTVIVDEASMLATGDLYRLSRLADQHRWRLALIGDPHQLQAVGRGGMFAELCATGRTVDLDHIHRFRSHWEAAASLKLRHGDPAGLDAYLNHHRVFAAPVVEHLDNIAAAWIGSHRRGEQCAITTITNDHVDAINAHIQQRRLSEGQLGSDCLETGDATFWVGDFVTTRRNQRQLHTTTGDSVRNRDYWTVDAITAVGGLTVTRIDGHGTITLPAEYVSEHVQLGYAATEPGNQSDTADRSITLATPVTTCRGLYVAVTRGRDENLICVVTDTHDLADAVDVLEQVLASDRSDTPATTVHRDLAATVPPASTLQRRCVIPEWFHDLHHQATVALADVGDAVEAQRRDDAELDRRITELGNQLRELEPHCAPHDDKIAGAGRDVEVARRRHRQAVRALADSGLLGRRAARHDLANATQELTAAETAFAESIGGAQPVLDQRNELRDERSRLRDHATRSRPLIQALDRYDHRLETAERTVEALGTWKNWASGRDISSEQLVDAATALSDSGRADYVALGEPLLDWINQHGITIEPKTPQIEPPGLDIGL